MELPRSIPPGLRFRILFLHPFMLAAVLPVFMGVVFTVVFSSMTSFDVFKFKGGEPRVKAVITQVRRTNDKENSRYLYAYDYAYQLQDSVMRTGTSYDFHRDLPSDTVDVEYIPGSPDISRIAGMRISPFHPALALSGLLPALIGIVFFFIAFAKGKKNLYLVRNGILTEGKVISKERTSTRINNRYVYRITFEFMAGGTPVQAVTRTHLVDRLLDEAHEKVVYDPNDPSKANFVDAMPKSVRKFFDGESVQ
ncbi:MAG TPA: DUF3592 domain-containing protein [Bacteroidia bacterium]|nr:DUF3592 domain-containing protein [Bacteroidia bacterium]